MARKLLSSLAEASGELHRRYRELVACAATGEPLPDAAVWLVDNYAFLHTQIRELTDALPSSFYKSLPSKNGVPKILPLAVAIAEMAGTDFSGARLKQLLDEPHIRSLRLAELWALGPMLKLVLVLQIVEARDFESDSAESTIRRAITALRMFESVPWRDLVESVSDVERALRDDPAGVYAGMTFRTRDDCRHQVEAIGRRSRLDELQVTQLALEMARERNVTVAYFLIGRGVGELRSRAHYRTTLGELPVRFAQCFPNALYFSGLAIFTAALLLPFAHAGWLVLMLLLLPASQLALSLLNRIVNLGVSPRTLPRMDFSEGIPPECQTFVVVPTLLLSLREVEKLLERLEIHYIANRDNNLFFALLTDFPDADSARGDTRVLEACVKGIELLNRRYRNGHDPFFLFHRASEWNEHESVWMGRERKRGKLNDFNALILGKGDAFAVKVGDLSVLPGTKYVITLDSDTELPLDTARELIATMAHPLNHPQMDERTNVVKSGYALLQPRVGISMESAARSRLAWIYSGQTGFDPYTTAVSDVYQDLWGAASFTGKGIYDVRAFHQAAGDRFPDNALLSHDLIEGEHVRTGLVTDLEVVDDFPATYESYSRRKHRWVRGDWQIASWILGRRAANPLGVLSRWKILDNLRRSLFEISMVGLLLTGKGAMAALAALLAPAYIDLVFALLLPPPPRFWGAYLRETGIQFARMHLEAVVNLAMLLHQACLMADACMRTLVRRHITHKHLLEWQTMAQSEAAGGVKFDLVRRYLLLCPPLAVLAGIAFGVPAAVVALWLASPLVALWLNSRSATRREQPLSSADFLRGVALRTWRYFTDYVLPESHWLAPDNVQHDPPAQAHRTSPTNLGLQLTAYLAAHDFGYVTHQEMLMLLQQSLSAMGSLERHRGHFFNWYDTRTLAALDPRFISTVDSGNLAASLVAVKQGCLALPGKPLVGQATLESLRDHCVLLREELPFDRRHATIMKLVESALKLCEAKPTDLFYWESVLSDVRGIILRMREPLYRMSGVNEEACYWFEVLQSRVEIALNDLYALAPWLAPPVEDELRIASAYVPELLDLLCRIPTLGELPAHIREIAGAIDGRLKESRPLCQASRSVLERLRTELPAAEANALRLLDDCEKQAGLTARWIDEMEFGFLFDRKRKLMHIGYHAGTEKVDPAYYDLLASEARSAVFLAIAKGEIPREAWFRLGRRLVSHRGRRALVSWSGTMFEYLMPNLFMKTYRHTLLDQSLEMVTAIQQQHGRENGVPWGISESACSERDHSLCYQYHAFGIPALAADTRSAQGLVVAPYATMLACMVNREAAEENLRRMAVNGLLTRHGFYESADYSGGGQPEIVRSHMVHHQAMGLMALANALLGAPMQERFHADPIVQATEYLLQERLQALIQVAPELTIERPRVRKTVNAEEAHSAHAAAARPN